MTISEDALQARLHAADPARSLAADDSHLADMMAAASVRRGRGARRWIIGGVVGLLAIGVAAPATATVVREFFAQTGVYGTGGSEEPDTSEYINLTAPDAGTYMLTIYPDYLPVPTAVGKDEFRQRVVDAVIANAKVTSANEGGADVVQQRTGLVRTYESAAYAEWIGVWLAADSAGDVVARAEAARALRDACSWPAIVETDGGGIVAMMEQFADAAEIGDRDGVEYAAQGNAEWPATGWDGIDRRWWIDQ